MSRPSIFPSSHHNNTTNQPTNSTTSNANTALQTRINQKRHELLQLQSLRDLSAQLALQMTALESKLATLSDGAEAVGCVLENWEGVLRGIGMACSKLPMPSSSSQQEGEGDIEADEDKARIPSQTEPELPVTLVRIPISDIKKETDD